MRITYLHQYFNTPTMHGPTRSYELAHRLVTAGHEVNMITSWRDPDGRRGWFKTSEGGINVHWLPVPYSNNMSHGARVRSFIQFAMRAARRAGSLETDVVFATSTPLTIALPGAYAAWRNRVPMVFEVRDLWPDVPIALGALKGRLVERLAYGLESFAYRRSSHIVALTPTMRDFISGKRIPLEKISVIPNGSDVDRAASSEVATPAAHNQGNGRSTILYCGSLGPAHGPEYLVQLAIALYKAGLHSQILVVGKGKLELQLIEAARKAGCLNKTIRFLGSVPREQIHGYFKAADASLMTMARTELLYRHSVQNKFFDSLAAGCPVFANYRGWASEIAEVEGVGAILPFDDISAAARQLHDRVSDVQWIERTSRFARALAEERFSLDLLASKLESTLLQVIRSAH